MNSSEQPGLTPLTYLSTSEALEVVRRSLRYAWDLRYRYLVKVLIVVASIFPPLILVWPFKIIVDSVVLGNPISEGMTEYPFYIQPLVNYLVDKSPLTIMLTLVVFGFFTIVLLGIFGETGTTGSQRDVADSDLAEGTDIATRTENEANRARTNLGGILGYFEFLWTIRITHLINFKLRSVVYRKLQCLPMSTLEDERIGDAVYRVMYDTPAITDLCEKSIVVPIQTVFQLYIVLLMLDTSFPEAPELFWIGTTGLPLFFIVFLIYTRRLRRQWELSRDLGATTTASMEESLENILAVQSLGGQQKELDRFSQSSKESFKGYLIGYGITLLVTLTGIFLFGGVVAYAMVVMTDLVINETITPGDIVVLYVFYSRIFTASRSLGGLWLDLQAPIAGMRRVFLLLDLPVENPLDEGQDETTEDLEIRQGIEFKDVCFSYPDGTRVLNNINLTAKLGEMVALVGATGAGKTSLSYLIPRFHKPESGEILIDGKDINRYSLKSLRSQMAFVFQETTLSEGTIEENIKSSNPNATDEDMKLAATTAGANDFIEAQPDGYQTHIGTKGSKLSVGQKQRISIARGLIRDVPILILDEPTSALDPETENELVRTLHKASKSKLVIIVAHRLSTIRAADQILFMEDGEITERGSHDELIGIEDGAYREFVALQSRVIQQE